MIKLESVHIEETRGIRSLNIEFGQKSFAISGPNGSGKSGVIDAIEFALTGNIKRLTGSGTKGLSVPEHGPHVDKVKFPGAAFVELKLFLPQMGKTATIKRSLDQPNKPEVTPNEQAIIEALADVAGHPEITLSRRDILRFILVEPSKRSQEIQTLLKLDQLGETRASLKSTSNSLKRKFDQASSNANDARAKLTLHLQVEKLGSEVVLAAINDKRAILGLDPISELSSETKLNEGLEAKDDSSKFSKVTALSDLGVFEEVVGTLPEMDKVEQTKALDGIKKLEEDPALFVIIQQRSFIEKGLEFVDGPDCPLCDLSWEDEEHLRDHLGAKLDKSRAAGELTDAMIAAAAVLSRSISSLAQKLKTLEGISKAKEVNLEEASEFFLSWRTDLEQFQRSLSSIDGLLTLKERLESDWLNVPEKLSEQVATLRKKIEAVPDQSSIIAAQSYLTIAQERIEDYRACMKVKEQTQISHTAGKKAYDVYCQVLETELDTLYQYVQNDFSTYYREINEDDEATFAAKFTPSEGALVLDVNFYDRGLYPPGAYHSEGHQDGMGVCLYLALMKRLFGDEFSLALLDDVVMSVDSGHRYQFCKLLKSHFPDTQFVLTTHDRLWAEQMKSAGLVTSKTSLVFHSWSVDTGPLVESNNEIWDEIDTFLATGKVEIAASSLRRHLEYFANHQCDQLAAQTQFKADGNYDLGDLLPAALSRMKKLLGKAASAAHSWGDKDAHDRAVNHKQMLSDCSAASQVEQWVINKGVHYNDWANLGKTDFQPVVAAFKELTDLFQCGSCDGWLFVDNKHQPQSLRCACSKTSYNLNEKSKS